MPVRSKEYYRLKAERWRAANPELNRAAQRKARNDNKSQAIDLFGGKCCRCGEMYPSECYDFHHIDQRNKDVMIARILQGSWKRAEKELRKCIMVCANCHRIIHKESGTIGPLKDKRDSHDIKIEIQMTIPWG